MYGLPSTHDYGSAADLPSYLVGVMRAVAAASECTALLHNWQAAQVLQEAPIARSSRLHSQQTSNPSTALSHAPYEKIPPAVAQSMPKQSVSAQSSTPRSPELGQMCNVQHARNSKRSSREAIAQALPHAVDARVKPAKRHRGARHDAVRDRAAQIFSSPVMFPHTGIDHKSLIAAMDAREARLNDSTGSSTHTHTMP